ncbi:serine/threonine-protein kinase TTK/MPS1 [Nematocida major]|uniref:serine/threonine-protein kinase TTK/MPS1 n=1 Tax=Nematocida major TaxID=1912982 RepID=UPI0020085DA8|nr:serine/threonine-protein kinase TTK/MPS1 [Nematocida major]KAH9385994.1 serine/threonine-protein kinase TTK/MPS1 [Nematocida major]
MERLFHIEDILAYIDEQKKDHASATRQLSMYYEATQKNLEPNEKTYSLWEGYIHTLEKNGYGHSEIREVYKMLKSKFWKFARFWQGWFDYESRLPIDQSKRARVLELANDILQYKECAQKEKIMLWVREKSFSGGEDITRTVYMYPETPRSQLFSDAHGASSSSSNIEHAKGAHEEWPSLSVAAHTTNPAASPKKARASFASLHPAGHLGAERQSAQKDADSDAGDSPDRANPSSAPDFIPMDIDIESVRSGDSGYIMCPMGTPLHASGQAPGAGHYELSERRSSLQENTSTNLDRAPQQKLHPKNHTKGGEITQTGGVFDLEIGQGVAETECEKPSSALATDKYFNSTASKKITLNGKRLRILRTIGKGGSAKVYQVLSDKNEVFALKKIKIAQESEDSEIYKSYVNEISLLKRLKNRHEIVTMKDSYVNRDKIAILMEHGDIDLCRFLEIEKNRFPGGYRKSDENHTMISIWEQMLRAVKCIHENRIVHRDLKPGNFLFVNGRLKLIDFGISKEIRNDTTNIIREKQIGTINYMSPEAIIEGKTKMGRNSDIWSLGCILYEMYFGESPFMRFSNLVQRMQKLLDPDYSVELPCEEENDNGYALVAAEIRKCLVRDPKGRAKIESLLKSGICGKLQSRAEAEPAEKKCSFNKLELKEFISKIMDLKHTSSTEEGHEKIIEKITSLYFDKQ